MAYLKQDMADLALADAERSLEIESSVDNIKAYWRKAQALLDLNRLDEAEAAASDGLELHGRNPHLNKVRRKAREQSVTNKLMAGDWVGKLDNGIEQRLAFSNEGEMTMTVFGHSLTSTYELSVEGNPRSMVVRMKQQLGPGSPPPAPPMVYIFEFHGDDTELWLCHPTDGSKEMPTKFAGSGLVKHKRVKAAKPEVEEASTEPLDERCARYMEEMIKVLPLLAPQLPEKPSDEEIKDEVRICGSVSALKRKFGLEVHRRAVDLAKDPSTADSEDMKGLAEQLRKRFISRKLLEEEPKALRKPAAAAATATAAPAAPATVVTDERSSKAVEAPVSSAAKPSAGLPAGVELLPSSGDSQKAPDLLTRLATCICCKSA
jgi:hypothetical protein